MPDQRKPSHRNAQFFGGVLPGVTVRVTSPALQIPELVTVTEGNGGERFPMRRAHVPGPALRALLLAAVIAAGARVQAEQVTDVYEPQRG